MDKCWQIKTYNALFHSTQYHGLDTKNTQISMLGKLI
jgi:hypothetical protein